MTTKKELEKALEETETELERALDFLGLLSKWGGEIISVRRCSLEEISVAKKLDRNYVDPDGFGYIYRMPGKK